MSDQSLERHLTETAALEGGYAYVNPVAEEARPEERRFRVDTTEKAEWAMRKLASAKRAIETRQAEAAAWRARVDEWLTQVTKPLERNAAFFESLLIDWHRRTNAEEAAQGIDERKRTKTLVLPSGKAAARRQAGTLEVIDEGAFVAWAIRHERFGLLKITARKSDIKAAEDLHLPEEGGTVVELDTGEVVPGLLMHPGEIRYRVEPNLARPSALSPPSADFDVSSDPYSGPEEPTEGDSTQ